jgi:hypothetical protein
MEEKSGFGSRKERDKFKKTLRPTQSPAQWASEDSSLEVKRQKHVAVHAPPSSAEFKNIWSYTSTPIRLQFMMLN